MWREKGRVLQRIMVRSDRDPLRLVWGFAYRVVIRSLATALTIGQRDATVYLRGSWGHGDVSHGLSDIDMAIVAPPNRREKISARWHRLVDLIPGLSTLVHMAIYDPEELKKVSASSTLTATGAVHLGSNAPPDEAGIQIRPGLSDGPLAGWRPVKGPDNRPAPPVPDDQTRRIGAWLELQSTWRDAFRACMRPDALTTPLMCVKLVAGPAQIWLTLITGQQPASRQDALELAQRHLPEERDAFERMLALRRTLHRCPPPPLSEALNTCLRLSDRIARHLQTDVEHAGTTGVQLLGSGQQLALPPEPSRPLRELLDDEPRLLPLADWRARSWPLHPDDAFAPTDLDASDPTVLRAAVEAAGGYGPYPALRSGELTILAGPGLLRAIQCRLTDPVSFALAAGQTVAEFPNVRGWSAKDCARRAVAEHRAWLGTDLSRGGHLLDQWMEAQSRTWASGNDVLGWLLSAARAGLFFESVQRGRPQLALTVVAAAERLDQDLAGRHQPCLEAFAEYRACRVEGSIPRADRVLQLRDAVLRMPAYAYETPWTTHARSRPTAVRS